MNFVIYLGCKLLLVKHTPSILQELKKIKTIINNIETEKKKDLYYIYLFIVKDSGLFIPPKNIT
jgi:hypothetical protein